MIGENKEAKAREEVESRTAKMRSEAVGVIRDTTTFKLQREWKLPGDLYRVLYAPDGRHLVTLNGNGTAYVLRLAPPKPSPLQ